MLIEVDHDVVQKLFKEINRNLSLLEIEKEVTFQRRVLDELLENDSGPLKQLAKIFKVDI